MNDNTLTIMVTNTFALDWLENHYREMIFNLLLEMYEKPYEIVITTMDNVEPAIKKSIYDLMMDEQVDFKTARENR